MSAIVKYYFALDMVPGGVSPVIHLSKYAEAYELVFLLYSRTGELTIPSNGKAIIRGTKSDGKVFSANATLSGNTVTVTGDKQMTAAEGKNTFEIVLSDSSGKELGSSNFTIQVEAASMDYGTTSDSQLLEISNVTATAAELTQASTNIQESVRTFEAMLATLEPDKTLSKDGEAADAKATGDRLIAVETTAQTTADTVGSIVDATLAVSGKAADSATVGSELSNLKSEIGLKSLEYTKGYYIDVSGATADISNPASSVNWAYAIDECEGGDVYNVIAYGSSAGRMWAFLDDDGTVLYRPPTTINVSREFYTVQAPSGAKWFVSNTKYTEIEGICIKGNLDLSNAFVPLQHGGKIIEPNTNILSLEAGSYFCILAGTPATLENCPTTDTFRLTIYKRGAYNNQDYLGAIIIDASKQIWINAKGANGWTGWLSIVNKKILEGALNEALNELTAPIPSTFSRAEFVCGSLAADGTQRYAISAIITRDYIPEHVYGFRVTSGNYKVALGIWTKADGTFRRSYWYTPDTPVAAYDCAYVFDHSLYNYKLYILRTDEAALTNPSEAVSSIMVAVDAKKIIDSYHTMIGEHINLGEATSRLSNRVFDIMRNNYNVDYANAMFPISLNSVYGDNQNVHPKVLYFADGFGGHKFWMAYTPYPFGSTPYENPCIAFSDDGYEWENIEGNPIDEPGENDSGYMSDTHLVLRDGVLECWYRLADDVNMQEIIFRKTSSDGIHWSDRETLHTSADGSISTCLSPAIIWDGEKYHIWTVYWGSRSYIEYWESMTGRDWEKIRDIDLNYTDTSDGTKYNVWHLDVVKDSEKYILLTMCKYSHRIPPWSLFIATSEDNITYETPYIVMRGNPSSWDQMMYRSTLVKVETEYRLYYSAMDTHYVHGIGLTVSNTLDSFLPVLSKDVNEHLSY